MVFMELIFFSYIIREEPEGKWGRSLNGTFTGMMGQLQRQEVDFCTLCGITYERNYIINHLQAYSADPLAVVSLKPPYLSRHFLLVRPFTGECVIFESVCAFFFLTKFIVLFPYQVEKLILLLF